MALSSDVRWSVRGDGSTTNGGGRRRSASEDDYTLQAAAQISVTDAVTNGTTTITSASANFETDVVGHVCYVAGGTGSVSADRYEITARSSATSITVDRSTGLTAGTGVTLKIGGALADPGHAAALATVSGHDIVWKDSTVTITTSTPGVGGPVLLASAIGVTLQGYLNTPGDLGAKPVLDAGAVTGVNLFSAQGTGSNFLQAFISVAADCQAGASNKAFNLPSNRCYAYLCYAYDATVGFAGTSTTGHTLRCMAELCSTYGFDSLIGTRFCVAKSSTTAGFRLGANSSNSCNVAHSGGIGFLFNGHGATLSNSVGDSNSTYGFDVGANSGILSNCLGSNNTTAAFRCSTNNLAMLINCAHYNNTRASGTFAADIDAITLSAQPYQTAGSDFRPNTTSGGGASLRAAGIGVYGQTNSVDVGAVQSAGGSLMKVGSMHGGFQRT